MEGPWSFENQMLAVQDFNGDFRPSDYKFERTFIWTKIYGLPLNLMKMDIAERIENKIGASQKIDTSMTRSGWVKNLRIRVEIDITKPLRRFVTISRGGGKEDICERVSFERLPMFCYAVVYWDIQRWSVKQQTIKDQVQVLSNMVYG